MKTYFRLLTGFVVLFSIPFGPAAFGGYVNTRFVTGDTFFTNPLKHWQGDRLSNLFTAPEGTTVSLWNPAANSFDVTSQFLAGSWTIDLVLPVGTGARLHSSQPFINTFVGELVDRAGGAYDDGDEMLPAPVFAGPAGTYLLADKLPVAATGNDVFLHVIGRLPVPGEQISRLNPGTATYSTSTFLAGGI